MDHVEVLMASKTRDMVTNHRKTKELNSAKTCELLFKEARMSRKESRYISMNRYISLSSLIAGNHSALHDQVLKARETQALMQ